MQECDKYFFLPKLAFSMKREGLESELTVEIFAFIGPSICGKELGSFRIEVSLEGKCRRDF